MNKLRNNNGFTLIEVIVSIAILGIVVISFQYLFTFAYTQIISAGHKSEATFESHQEVEKRIAGDLSNGSVISTTGSTITINLPASSSITIPPQSGTVITFKAVKDGRTGTVTTFLPD